MSTLYKFVASRISALSIAKGSLKFTKIDDLNDPSELAILISEEAVDNSLANIRQFGFSNEQFSWLNHQEKLLELLSPETKILRSPANIEAANIIIKAQIYDNKEYMRESLFRTIELIRLRVGILSLTERFDSLPMWAHYGSLATGYLIRFDGLERVFAGDVTGSLNCLKPVRYVDDLVGMTHDPSTQDDIFFCKFKDWSYEREWRVVRALSDCNFHTTANLFLHQIDPSHVTGVFAGWNVSRQETEEMASELRLINPDAKFSIASLARGKVNLQLP